MRIRMMVVLAVASVMWLDGVAQGQVVGACCMPSGGQTICTQLSFFNCITNQGVYFGDGSSCAAGGTCPEQVGGCCELTGICTTTRKSSCTNAGDTFLPDFNCFQIDCSRGACCVPTGSTTICQMTTQFNCIASDGLYIGDGVLCESGHCVGVALGSCCIWDGLVGTNFCLMLTQTECNAQGGYFNSDAVCSTVDCVLGPDQGACCIPDGIAGNFCALATQGECEVAGGQFNQGVGCSNVLQCDTVGSCCIDDICQTLRQNTCIVSGGTFLGVSTSCPTGIGIPSGSLLITIAIGGVGNFVIYNSNPAFPCTSQSIHPINYLPAGTEFGPNGNLFIWKQDSGGLYEYDGQSGQFVQIRVANNAGGALQGRGFTFMPNGDILVASGLSHNVARFDWATGAYLGEFIPAGLGGLDTAFGITYGPDGNVFVASFNGPNGGAVYEYDAATGILVNSFPAGGAMFLTFKPWADCNADGTSDSIEISQGAPDCYGNEIPDECDVSSGASNDCNANGIPDECEVFIFDCNANGIPDSCDITSGASQDIDGNGIPDECDVAPANNSCGQSVTVMTGSNPISTVNAISTGHAEGCGSFDSDVWYHYVASCTGFLTVSICDADFDTVLAVYGFVCPTGSNAAIVCSDDSCGTGSMITIPIVPGFYRIRVGGVGGQQGTGTMIVDCTLNPPCPADISPVGGNGVVDTADLVAVLNGFGPCGAPPLSCDADITPLGGNGVVNIDDLVAVLNGFGVCP